MSQKKWKTFKRKKPSGLKIAYCKIQTEGIFEAVE